MKHSERVFLGLALLHRYRNKRQGTRFEDLYELLDEKEQKQAEILGKAMRFGAMFWMQPDVPMGQFKWFPQKRVLELRIPKAASALYGEVAEARFLSLAASLNAETKVKFTAG